MKKFAFILLLFGSIYANSEKILKSVEVFSSEVSAQAIFFFSGKCDPSSEVFDTDSRLLVFFPGLKLGTVDYSAFIHNLNKFALIEDIQLEVAEKNENGKLVSGVSLDIKFIPNKAFVKLIQMNERNKFILEVYSKDELQKLGRSTGGPINLAYNSFQKKKDLLLV